MTATILDTEQFIVDRLAPLRDEGLTVRALPNKSNQIGEIVGNGIITVSWVKDEPEGNSDSLGIVCQKVNSEWVLDIRVKDLRDDESAGGLVLRNLVYNYLLGLQTPSGGRILAKSFQFVDRTNNVWVFDCRLTVPTIIMGKPFEDEGSVPLVQVTLGGTIGGGVVGGYPGDTVFVPELPEPITATIQYQSLFSAELSVTKPLTATITATSSGSATLSNPNISAAIVLTSSTVASLQISKPLAATIIGTSVTSASLNVVKNLTASVPVVSGMIASVTIGKLFAATVTVNSSANATLVMLHQLTAIVTIESGFVASLSAAPVSPLSGMAAWWDAADGGSMTLSGFDVTQWADKSGSGRHFLISASRPTYNANGLGAGKPGLIFNASQYLDTAAFTAFTGTLTTTYVVAILYSAVSTTAMLICSSTAGNAVSTGSVASQGNILRPNGGPGIRIQRNNLTSGVAFEQGYNVPFVGTSMCDNTNIFCWANDTQGNLATVTGAFGYTLHRLGAATGGSPGNFWNGVISEVLIYEGVAHDSAQRQHNWNYLANKWGIVL